jgi:hypothetical protein
MNIQEVFARYRMECAAVSEELDRTFAFNPSLSSDERLLRPKRMKELIERRDVVMRELLALRGPGITSAPHSLPAVPPQAADTSANHNKTDSAAAIQPSTWESQNEAAEAETVAS